MTMILDKKKYITGAELKTAGFSYYRINKLVSEGHLKKVNHTVYENLMYSSKENDFYTAYACVPSGTICLLSAARYYHLTTYIPDSIDVAIQRKERVSTLPETPEMKLHYFSSVRENTGKILVKEGINEFSIFNLEKTVIDIICYRNKVGIEETGEILREYMSRKDRNLDLFFTYAKMLRCEKIVRTYMEVLM